MAPKRLPMASFDRLDERAARPAFDVVAGVKPAFELRVASPCGKIGRMLPSRRS